MKAGTFIFVSIYSFGWLTMAFDWIWWGDIARYGFHLDNLLPILLYHAVLALGVKCFWSSGIGAVPRPRPASSLVNWIIKPIGPAVPQPLGDLDIASEFRYAAYYVVVAVVLGIIAVIVFPTPTIPSL